MSKPLFDFDDGDFLFRNGDTAFDSDGNTMMRMSDNLAMDMDSGELHLTSSWDHEDEQLLCFEKVLNVNQMATCGGYKFKVARTAILKNGLTVGKNEVSC